MSKASRLRYLRASANRERCVPVYDAAAGDRRVPLLKTLVSNRCTNNCSYCAFRSGRRVRREKFDPPELANIALKLWRRGFIEGVFLSSSVDSNPDEATRREIETAKILREGGYTDYLHLRLMPSCNRHLVKRAVELADRIGLNLENPDEGELSEIRPDVNQKIDVWRRLRWCKLESERLSDFDNFGSSPPSIDTQFIVGAGKETDLQILKSTSKLFEDYGLSRVYYSGFSPVERTPLENAQPCSESRERRLYQASFLIRDYPFDLGDFEPALDEDGFLRDADPKITLAKSRPDLFPVDLNTASFKKLQIVPGIGPKTARKILRVRDEKSFESISDAYERASSRIKSARSYLAVDGKGQVRLEDFAE